MKQNVSLLSGIVRDSADSAFAWQIQGQIQDLLYSFTSRYTALWLNFLFLFYLGFEVFSYTLVQWHWFFLCK